MVPTHTFFHSVGEYFPVPDYLNSRAAAISIFQNTITFVSIKQTPAGLIPNPPDIVKLPIGTIENGAIKDSAAVITALKSFQQKHKTRDIFASLPEEYAYIYPITISQYASYDEIVTAVEFSLQEHVPLAPEFLTYDWEIVERSLQGTLLSVVAYDSRIRDAYESLYAEAGYRVRGLEPHICSAARACVSQKMTTGVLLLDIDTTVTTLAVVYKGRALSSSTLQISQRFTDSESASKLTDEKSTDDTDIKDSDIQKSSSDEKKVKATDDVHHTQLHIEDLDEWFVELMSYESYWSGTTHAESHIPPVSEVILCGSRATTPGLDEWVGERLQLPTSVANVWGNMFSFNDVIPRIPQKDSTQYATVNGLLLSNISNIW